MAGLPRKSDPNLLVGFETSDDAGVYRLGDDTAIVVTADFITPPVDDPFTFGQIGAANSLSDVYAMGGRPVACLNLIGFPEEDLGPEVLHGIVEGALSKITEAGAVLAGGHTTNDDEPKFGLSVTGVVHPDRYWRNAGARPGDALILTKPIGSGVIFNANLRNALPAAALNRTLAVLTELNRTAAETLARFDVHAATDITGFGLAGHALEMAKGSGVTLEIDVDSVPTLPEALEMYERGITTGANAENRAQVGEAALYEKELPGKRGEILVDPQTSGGLFAAVPEAQAGAAVVALQQAGVETACIVGRAVSLSPPHYLKFQ